MLIKILNDSLISKSNGLLTNLIYSSPFGVSLMPALAMLLTQEVSLGMR